MAVAKTGAIFKSFTFDGASSRDYGVYITGSAVYNAPERDVEMVAIPGRDGTFAMDNGRFENIEVTYPAGMFADDETDFASGISGLRNLLCSKKGYCRLTDEYNPNEYRMAIYKSGLEVEPSQLRAGEFEITFECMPQRFLTSGEVKTTMNSGDTISNPTRFDSHPMIEATGYGDIDFNGYPITIQNENLGVITLIDCEVDKTTFTFDSNLVNTGDDLTIEMADVTNFFDSFYPRTILNATPGTRVRTKSNADYFECDIISTGSQMDHTKADITMWGWNVTFDVGTSGYINVQRPVSYNLSGGTTVTRTYDYRVAYDGDDTVTLQYAIDGTWGYASGEIVNFTADSTVSALGNPTYLDCDTGLVYKIQSGQYVSLDRLIDLGTNLPVLNPGANTVTFDNTFTSVKVIPRWWIV